MSDLFGNHIVGFPTRRLIYCVTTSLSFNLRCDVTPMKTLPCEDGFSSIYILNDNIQLIKRNKVKQINKAKEFGMNLGK